MKKTVYSQRSQVVNEIFNGENHPDKILIVPLDYAKTNHAVQFCFATGEHLLNNALTVYNDSRGAAYLLKIIRRLVKEQRFYFPAKSWLADDFSPDSDEHILFYLSTIKNIKDKLKGYDLSGIKDENNYLLKEEKTIIFFSNYLRRRGSFFAFFSETTLTFRGKSDPDAVF